MGEDVPRVLDGTERRGHHDIAAAAQRRRVRLLDDHFADAEQRHHDRDAEAEAGGEHGRPPRPDGERTQRESENHDASIPFFMAKRRVARAASAALCVTTRIAVPSAWTRSNNAAT